MIVAGLDVATTSGLCILDGERIIHIESYRPPGKTDAEIFHGFRVWLRSMLLAHEVEHAAVEEPLRSDLRKRNADGTEEALTNMRTYLRLYGLRGHAIEVCHSLNIGCEECNQSSWRKAFTGNGRANKDQVLALARQLVPRLKSKDSSDALGVAWWLNGHLKTAQLVRPGDLFAKDAA